MSDPLGKLSLRQRKYVFTFRGKVRDTLQVINFAERRPNIELVMEYGGYRRST